jgi:ABC-type sulfate transport system substrate-binding protein
MIQPVSFIKNITKFWSVLETKTGQEVEFKQSHGGSGKQARALQMVYKQMW